jgi:hypothetical protein
VEGVVVGLWGAPGGKIPRGGALVSVNCAHLRVWEMGRGSLRCSGKGVLSYSAGHGSLGAFPWFVPRTL